MHESSEVGYVAINHKQGLHKKILLISFSPKQNYTVEASHKAGLTSSEETALLGSPKHAEVILQSGQAKVNSSARMEMFLMLYT